MAEFTVKQVRGDIARARAALAKQTRTKVRGELRRIVADASLPLRRDIREAARDRLPRKGGLNEWAAVLPRAVVTTRGDEVGVKITDSKSGHDLKSLDDGKVRHPLYGNRKHWYLQTIAPGFFTDTVEQNTEVADRVRAGVDRYVADIVREVG